MKKKIKYFIRDTLRLFLGPRLYSRIRFYLVHGYFLNFESPRSFSEKIVYRKFCKSSIGFSKFVDKYTVRDYVEKKIGSQYLIPLLKVSTKLNKQEFNDLPNSFVIKTSNGGGGENVMLVEDKSNLNLDFICNKFNNYLGIKVGKIVDEHFYDIEKPCVVFEKLIKHNDGRYPSDYKIHVFNSKKTKVIIQVDSDRFGNHKRSLYDENLNKLSFDIQPKYEPVDNDYSFPDNYIHMLDLAKKLAEDFKYVRVDMYNVDGQIFFGELTFCHGSGWEPFSSKEADFMLGNYWKEYN